MTKRKHIPMRTCVGCGGKFPKRELVRIVRTLQGTVEVDPTGKKPGRGAYLCPKEECWKQGLKKDRLAVALKGTVSEQDKANLMEFFNTNIKTTAR